MTITATGSTRATRIRHRPNCTGGAPYLDTLASGREVTRCPGCQKFAWTPHNAATAPWTAAPTLSPTPAPVVALEPAPARVRYVCRAHPRRPVSWRGRDCPECRAEHDARQKLRRQTARARQRRAARADQTD